MGSGDGKERTLGEEIRDRDRQPRRREGGIFEGRAKELPEIVAGSDESGIDPYHSGEWTDALLCGELAWFGDAPVRARCPTPVRVSGGGSARNADAAGGGTASSPATVELEVVDLLKLGLRNRW